MNEPFVTVADVIEFFKTIPPDAKIRVKLEVTRDWQTYTKYVNAVKYPTFIDGIEYSEKHNTVDFGME
jgi:hypothetical protein